MAAESVETGEEDVSVLLAGLTFERSDVGTDADFARETALIGLKHQRIVTVIQH